MNYQNNQIKTKKKTSLDPDMANLVVKDIKITFKDIIGMEEVKEVID